MNLQYEQKTNKAQHVHYIIITDAFHCSIALRFIHSPGKSREILNCQKRPKVQFRL